MEKFTINIEINAFNSISLYMEPGEEVLAVAKKLSLVYAGCNIVVSMGGSAIRWIIQDNVIKIDNSDLNVFYSNVEPQDEWEWSCLGAYPKK